MTALLFITFVCFVLSATFSALLGLQRFIDAEVSSLHLSRGMAIILLILYLIYLFFRFKSHSYLFDERQQFGEVADNDNEYGGLLDAEQVEQESGRIERDVLSIEEQQVENGNECNGDYQVLSSTSASIALCTTTVLVVICSKYLVNSIASAVHDAFGSNVFVGLVLFPNIWNIAEGYTSLKIARKDRMDLVINLTNGSSMQTAAFVTPILLIVGWALNQPLSLNFSGFETMVLCMIMFILIVSTNQGRSNYLKGVIYLGL